MAHRDQSVHYVLFGLRDAASSKPDLFHQFGIMRDDYTPKPAYTAFKRSSPNPLPHSDENQFVGLLDALRRRS